MELLAPTSSPEALTGRGPGRGGRGVSGVWAPERPPEREEFHPGGAGGRGGLCHLRGVKVYLTLNTLLTDRGVALAAETGAWASDLGIDAVLVQDLGVARLLRRTCPDLPLHASTQITSTAWTDTGLRRPGHDPGGVVPGAVRRCHRGPMRPLPRGAEEFGHGALCMCYSGQCFLSAVLGGRSGNRGLCAQPCRLAFRWPGEKTPSHPLS